MKLGTQRHKKILRLARFLGVERPHAGGLFEFLTLLTAEQTPAGDIGSWADEEIAGDIGWHRDPAALIDAMVLAGTLDPCPVHRLVVHGWEDHAPEYIRKRLKRADAMTHKIDYRDAVARWAKPAVTIPESDRIRWRDWLKEQQNPLETGAADSGIPCPPHGIPRMPTIPCLTTPNHATPEEEEEEQESSPERSDARKPSDSPLLNLLSAYGHSPPPERDEAAAWLATVLVEIEAASEAELPDESSKRQRGALAKKITIARWKKYLAGERRFRGHSEHERMDKLRREAQERFGPAYEAERRSTAR